MKMGTVKQALSIIKSILLWALFSLMRFFPKSKKIIVFGSWFGKQYSDSPKVLFEYFILHQPESFISYFMVKDKRLFQTLKKLETFGQHILYSKSIRAFWVQLRSKTLVCCVTPEGEFIPTVFGGKIIINFSHGFGAKMPKPITSGLHSVVLRKSIYEKTNKIYYVVNAPIIMKYMKNIYPWSSRYLEIGSPRLDYFFDGKKEAIRNLGLSIKKIGKIFDKIILYMPTHRNEGNTHLDCSKILDLHSINNLMIEKNALFIIKKHFYHLGEQENLENYSNIVDLTNEIFDLQKLLKIGDVLVTDYSSVAFDFIMTDQPAIFYDFDLQDYVKKERGLFISAEDLAYGPIVQDKEGLTKAIKEAIEHPGSYKTLRKKVREKVYGSAISYPCCSDCVLAIKDLLYKKGR